MTIGKRILNLRKEFGMSQEDLAEAVDVSKQSVSKWELEKALPNVEKLIRLCEFFDVSSDYLLTGKQSINEERAQEEIAADIVEESTAKEENNINSDKSFEEEPEDKMTEVSANGKPAGRKKSFYIVGMVVSLVLTIIFFVGVYNIVIYNNMGIKDSDDQQYAYVESIYEQHTKANVVYWNEENEAIEKTVYLDLHGVNEGDWIYCYPDSEDDHAFRFRYNSNTCIVMVFLFALALIGFIVFLVLLIKNKKSIKKIAAITGLFLGLFSCGCSSDGNDSKEENKDEYEIVWIDDVDEADLETLNSETEYVEDEWIWESKDKSSFSIGNENITFSVPEGLYSTGITSYEDSAYELFYNEDMYENYSVNVSSMIEYSDLDAYGRALYSDVETVVSDSARIIETEEVTDSGIRVKMIKVIEESEHDYYYLHIYSGTILPSGLVFSVDASVLDEDEDRLNWDKIEKFYNDLY